MALQGRPVQHAREPCTEQTAPIRDDRQHAQGCGDGAGPKGGHSHQATLAMRVEAATKTASVRRWALPGRQRRSNFLEMFSVSATDHVVRARPIG